MGLSKLETTDFDNFAKQLSIKVLSNPNDLYAMWIEKDKIVMQIHFSKKDNKIKLLEGSLGASIKNANLTEEQKIGRCAEAIKNALWEQNNLQKQPNRVYIPTYE